MTCLLSLNIDRQVSRLIQLSKLTLEHKPIIVCIQDMFAHNTRDKAELTATLFPGYKAYTNNNETIGLVTLIATEDAQTCDINNYTDKEDMIAIQSTRIKQNNFHEETIVNIYIRPKATADKVSKALSWIERQVKDISRATIVGDINSTAITWDSECGKRIIKAPITAYERLKIAKGKIIKNWCDSKGMSCLNEDTRMPTYHSHEGYSSTIDVALVGTKAKRKWKLLHTIKAFDYGHSILMLKYYSIQAANLAAQTATKTVHDINKISQQHINTIKLSLTGLLDQLDSTNDENTMLRLMNIITDNLCAQIITIQEDIAKRVKHGRKIANKKSATMIQLNRLRTQSIILKLRKLENVKTIRRNPKKKGKLNDKRRKLCKQLIDKLIKAQHKSEHNKDLWNKWKCINVDKTNTDAQRLDIESKNDIEILAKQKFPTIKRNLYVYTSTQTCNNRIRINKQEAFRAIEKLKNKKYTTPDGIKMQVFYTIASRIPEIMHSIAKMSFYLGKIPCKAEFTQGTIIPKKAAQQFRIVHISNPIAAYLEQIALARLDYNLERNKLINGNQYGFTALRSRQDLAAKLCEQVHKRKQWGKATCVVSMDIEGAFDNVDQVLLIKKLSEELGDIALTKWIASFLDKRKITIRYKQFRSQYRTVCRGVPQGSALGPVLWNFSIYDIEKIMHKRQDDTLLLKYADDIYMITTGDDLKITQNEINNFVKAIQTLGLNVRPEKCSFMILFERPSILSMEQSLTIGQAKLAKVDKMNILGMRVNKTCQIDRQDETLPSKLANIAHMLNKLKRARLVRSNKEWRGLIDGLVNSQTIANLWPFLIKNQSDRLWIEKLTLKMLKITFDWPDNTPNKVVKLILDLREPMTTIRKLATDRLHLETGASYKYLMNITNELNSTINRRYANPDITMDIKEFDEHNNEKWIGQFWYILEGGKYSVLASISNGNIEPKLAHSSWYSPCSYTNTLVTLTKAATDDELKRITLVINGKCSILQALNNWMNHDERIIKLREHIHWAKWQLIAINGTQHEALKRVVKAHINNLGIRARPGDVLHNFNEWIRDNTERPRLDLSHNQALSSKPLREPNMLDYLIRLLSTKEYHQNADLERRANRTEVCKQIEPDHAKWMKLNPVKLDGRCMMMLSGLVSDPNSNQLARDTQTQICGYCRQTLSPRIKELEHRMKDCNSFNYVRQTSLAREIRGLAQIALPMNK